MRDPLKIIADCSTEAQHELLFARHLNGIKLVSRHDYAQNRLSQQSHIQLIAINEVMNLSCNVFFHNASHKVVKANDTMWHGFGLDSNDVTSDISFEDICESKEQALKVFDHDKQVMANNVMNLYDEEGDIKNYGSIRAVSIKMPEYNNTNNKIIGCFGSAVMLNNHTADEIAKQFSAMAKLLFINPMQIRNMIPGSAIDNIYFTRREIDIIRCIVRGKTMRETGMLLNIATRTVENYFAKIKCTIGVKSKSEFIDRVIDYFI